MTEVKTINLGRIRPVHRGTWHQINTYTFLDFVTFEGSTYLCTKIEGIPSNVALTNTTYWTLIAAKGADAVTATQKAATLEEVNLGKSSTYVVTPYTLAKAKAGGVASLDLNSKLHLTQLPMATDAEALEGTSTSRLLNAKQIKDFLDKHIVEHGQSVFYNSGTFKTGATVTGVYVTLAGGGGGGVAGYYAKTGDANQGYTYTTKAGASGGAGAGYFKYYLPVYPDTDYAVTVGAGGAASAYNVDAEDGMSSAFDSLTCLGGKGGNADKSAGEAGGIGGTRGQNGAENENVSSIPRKAALVGTSGGRNVTGGYGNGGNGGGANALISEPGQNGDNGICIIEW